MKDSLLDAHRKKGEEQSELSLRPQTLGEYIGQSANKANLSVFIQAAKSRGECLDHTLLYGPPGLGKTTLAYVIGNEMGGHVKLVNGPSIERPGDLAAILSELDRLGLGYNLIGQYATFIKVTNQEYVTDFYRVFREPYPLDISLYQGESILSIQVFSRQESDPELSALAARYHVTFNRFADTNVEMSAKEFLKSKGVDTIYRYLNLKPEEAMAFGDDLNDISMFNKVKYSVCMGNGKPLAKQAAYYVTDRIEEGGLYKALRHFGVID